MNRYPTILHGVKNIRRYGDSQVFEQMLIQAIAYAFADMETVIGASTHQKANVK